TLRRSLGRRSTSAIGRRARKRFTTPFRHTAWLLPSELLLAAVELLKLGSTGAADAVISVANSRCAFRPIPGAQVRPHQRHLHPPLSSAAALRQRHPGTSYCAARAARIPALWQETPTRAA